MSRLMQREDGTCIYIECDSTPANTFDLHARHNKGDRVRIKDGYDRAGEVYFYDAKSAYEIDTVSVVDGEGNMRCFLAEAIEPYPYTREERIERAIEDFEGVSQYNILGDERKALLFAILDAGI